MSKFTRLLVTAIMVFSLAASFAVLAQDDNDQDDNATQQATTGQETTARSLTPLTGSQQANGLPTNATLIDIVTLTGYDTYTFDLSAIGGTGAGRQLTTSRTGTGLFANLGSLSEQMSAQDVTLQQNPSEGQLQACGNVRVYKVSSQGSQDLWPNVGCAGNLVVVHAGGTGDYIFYRFNSIQNANNALLTMPLCPTPAQTTTTADGEVVTVTTVPAATCFWVAAQNQGMQSTTMTTQTTQAQPTQQPTDTNDNNDSDQATEEAGS